MRNEALQDLLQKYLNGQCDAEESALVDDWFNAQERNFDDSVLFSSQDREELERRMFARIRERIEAGHAGRQMKISKTGKLSGVATYGIAAAILFFAIGGLGALLFQENHAGVSATEALASNDHVVRVANRNTEAATHVLSDGTVISLQPNGIIEYPEMFAGDIREIQLTGEAFFEVAKEKDRPFIINTGDITVRVLGTSFNVKAYSGAKEISVAVKTGKVSVYAKRAEHADATRKKEIILTPNQEVVYNKAGENFERKIVEEPRIILDNPTLFKARYDAAPVDKIFEELSINYGIDIVFDEELLSACRLTTSMDEEGLYERIMIICQAIGAKYSIDDGMIWISSNGCQ
jgi:ferric-dicitrate binding protein FerR (iron transport regulator)